MTKRKLGKSLSPKTNSACHGLTPCAVSLDNGWNDGEIKRRLDAEASVSYRFWVKEKEKVKSWKASHLKKAENVGKEKRSKMPASSSSRATAATFANGRKGSAVKNGKVIKKREAAHSSETKKSERNGNKESADGDDRNWLSTSKTEIRKSSRIKVMNFKEKKRKPGKSARDDRNDDDGKRDSDGSSLSCRSEQSRVTESEGEADEGDDSSDDGGVVDTEKFNQKQARDLVRKIQDGRTNKRLPTRPDKLFARWQLASSLPAVPQQHRDFGCVECPAPISPQRRKRLRVISLFDGISTALVALKTLGFEVEKYVASEVDEDAIKCSKRNHPEIVQVGDVRSITEENLDAWGPFDLMVGGSPCNDFSRANPRREGFTGKWGKLFFDYARILAICKEKHEEANVESPFYWLFENVIMDVEDKVTISYTLGCDPVSIDAMYVSPMRRQRLYWSNIPGLGDPLSPNPKLDRLFLQECLEPGRTARVKRIGCITTRWLSMAQGKFLQDPVVFQGKPDKLWSVEIERCFGFPDHYTDVANLTADRRMGLLGMSWSIPCVRRLFEPLLMYFKSHYS